MRFEQFSPFVWDNTVIRGNDVFFIPKFDIAIRHPLTTIREYVKCGENKEFIVC